MACHVRELCLQGIFWRMTTNDLTSAPEPAQATRTSPPRPAGAHGVKSPYGSERPGVIGPRGSERAPAGKGAREGEGPTEVGPKMGPYK